jgi:putative membrane protein
VDRPRRRPPLNEVGHDPDYRFSLANERTFLAWIRTALALIAGGVALANLVPDLTPELLRDGLAVLLVVLAVVLAIRSHARWDRAERAIRTDQPLEVGGGLVRLLAAGTTVVGAGVLVLLLLGR